jgi:hypothetical protein
MKSLLTKIAIGAAGLVLAAAPLAASAQSWHGHDGNRGGYHDNDRGRDGDRGRVYDRGRDYDRGGYRRTVYQQPYVNGYFGWAPGGFQGYYSNGGWYQHRRWNGGVWIYF